MELKQDVLMIGKTDNRRLLIVPYGIETADMPENLQGMVLLIVPYGIETCVPSCVRSDSFTFNRTLWN